MRAPKLARRSNYDHFRYLTPIGLYLLAITAFHRAGYATALIPWDYYQILDQKALTIAPMRSLLLLHSQPPLLNAMLAYLIRLSTSVGIELNLLVTFLFYTLGAISTILLYALVFDVTRSWTLAGFAVTVMLADPGYHLFQHLYFYPFILNFLFITALFLFSKLLKSYETRFFYGSVFILASVTNMRSLFHPIWALLCCFLLLLLLSILHGKDRILRCRHTWIASLLFIVLLIAWPLKNLLLFDTFTFSTWTGYNLSHRIPVNSQKIERYLHKGIVSDQTKRRIEKFAERFGQDQITLLSEATKFGGARNWNHYVFVETNKPLAEKAIQWRVSNPKAWIGNILLNYTKWTRATYIFPYDGEIQGPRNPVYLTYAEVYRDLFFADMQMRWLFQAWDENHSVTLFGAVVLPCLVLLVLLTLFTDWIKASRGLSINTCMLLIASFIFAWNLIVPCLTDGIEGNRMRFSVTPCLLVMTTIVTKKISERAQLSLGKR